MGVDSSPFFKLPTNRIKMFKGTALDPSRYTSSQKGKGPKKKKSHAKSNSGSASKSQDTQIETTEPQASCSLNKTVHKFTFKSTKAVKTGQVEETDDVLTNIYHGAVIGPECHRDKQEAPPSGQQVSDAAAQDSDDDSTVLESHENGGNDVKRVQFDYYHLLEVKRS